MTPARTVRGILLDANVLIDLLELDPGLLSLLGEAFPVVVVPSVVIDEVESLDDGRASRELGLTIVTAEDRDMAEASNVGGGLSFADAICLTIARREDLVCVTNDRALHVACENAGVTSSWGLELLEHLVNVGLLHAGTAIAHARTLAELAAGRLRPEMIEEFERRMRR